MFYSIHESLTPCTLAEVKELPRDVPFVAVLTGREWKALRGELGIELDIEMDVDAPRETKAVVNMDSLTGTFSIPDRQKISAPRHRFSFAMDEHGVALVDDGDYIARKVETISRTKKWRLPSLERFLYDLLETIIAQDLSLLESVEKRLNAIEEAILRGEVETYPQELNDIRGDLLDLRVHYEQLIDLGQELEENENGFFRDENLRYFRLFTERVMRLQDMVTGQREYVVQLRDLIQAQMDVKQNRIMTLLTVITSIFLPLTLIAGWYGMNFRYMPELNWKWGYPAVILVSVAIVIGCIRYFRKKKWM
jgi:magnesium transporter